MTDAPPWPWPAPTLDRGAWHLSVGFPMPDVDLLATTGGTESIGATPGWSVLFIYPWTGRPGLPNPPGWDDIPGAHGSTPEAEGYRDLHADFARRGITMRGLSAQSPADQLEFATRVALPFPLLSDAEFIATDAANLPTFVAGGVVYLKRLTLVMWGGRVVTRFYPVHPPHTHAGEVLAWMIQAMGGSK